MRPVHWLLMLFGREVVPATVLGRAVRSREFGHRFMAPGKPLRIAAPGALRAHAADARQGDRRVRGAPRERSARRSRRLAAGLGGRAIISEALLDEVTALVEWPVAIAGHFEERFLTLPREVLISTLQDHQRYFAVEATIAGLLPWFITVSNIESRDPRGGARRQRARRAAAPDRCGLLLGAGSQASRWPRAAPVLDARDLPGEARLARRAHRARDRGSPPAIAAQTGADVPARPRAPPQLAKCDLLTAMVGEFPGTAGHHGPLLRARRWRGAAGGRGDPRALPAARRRRCPAGARASAMRSRSPTSSIRWRASSPSVRSRPARAIRSACGARPSACCASCSSIGSISIWSS